MKSSTEYKSENSSYLFMLALVAALGGFLFGFDTAVISGTEGFVKNKFLLDALAEGWFVGIALLGCIIGVLIAGYLSDRFGRKPVLMLSAVLFFSSAAGCAISSSYLQLVIYRLIGGLGIGVASIVSPLYISELSIPRMRGKLVTLYQLAITIGILAAYLSNYWILTNAAANQNSAGTFWHWIMTDEMWRGMFGAGTIPAFLFILFLFFVPESPRFLMLKGKEEKAHLIIAHINGETNARKEIQDIKQSFNTKAGSYKDLFKPGIFKALIIGISLAVFSQFSGINAIIYYGVKILKEAGLGSGSAFWGQVTIGIVNTLFTFVAIFTIDKFGRKPLLIWGVSGAVIALIIVGALFALNITSSTLLLIFILLYIACFAFSFGPVVWVILSEIYPTRIRGRAMGIATLSLWIGTWIVGQFTPFLLETIKPYGTFWLFALTCFPAIIVTWKFVPETKNKPLEEIEKVWLKSD
jgi:SP family arabinose:H+ symporter-like MFS transporter